MLLISYDIQDPRRLRQTAKLLRKYGQRIQKSAFLCDISPARYAELHALLSKIPAEQDSILCWHLRANTRLDRIGLQIPTCISAPEALF